MKNISKICSAVILLLIVGCKSYDQSIAEIKNAYILGDTEKISVLMAETIKDNRNGKNELIWSLEGGSVYRMLAKFDESQENFERADSLYDSYQEMADMSMSDEASSLLVNPASRPYKGTYYDGIMMCVYQALNYMNKGDFENARIMITRSYLRQEDAVTANSERIERARQDEERPATNNEQQNKVINEQTSSALNSSQFSTGRQELINNLPDTTGYANYVNPFAVYLDALFHLYRGEDASDRERAKMSIRRALSFNPDNKAIQEDSLLLAKNLTPKPSVYVFFETGTAPAREAVRIDIPIVLSRMSYLGIAFPKLTPNDNYITKLFLTGDDNVQVSTEIVCDMDKIISQEFKNDLPLIMTRAVASAVTKATISYFLNKAAERHGGTAVLLTQIATITYQAATNVADARSWNTLPKQIQVCKIPMPESREINLSINQINSQTVKLIPGENICVFVRSTSTISPIFVNQFKLK